MRFVRYHKSIEAREELRLTMEQYQIILNQAPDIIFEWDLLKDTISYSGNWVKKFGYDPRYDVWTKVKVSEIKWGNMDAYLVSCFDITAYKHMQTPDK